LPVSLELSAADSELTEILAREPALHNAPRAFTSVHIRLERVPYRAAMALAAFRSREFHQPHENQMYAETHGICSLRLHPPSARCCCTPAINLRRHARICLEAIQSWWSRQFGVGESRRTRAYGRTTPRAPFRPGGPGRRREASIDASCTPVVSAGQPGSVGSVSTSVHPGSDCLLGFVAARCLLPFLNATPPTAKNRPV